MSVSIVQPGYQIIKQSSKMAEEAALELNKNEPLPLRDKSLDFNQIDFDAIEADQSNINALSQLNQAESYSRIGTNTLQRNQDMIGSLLDIHI